MTPTPTPVPGVNWYWDMQVAAPSSVAAIWAVLLLLMVVMLARPQTRTLQVFELVFLCCLPLMVLNAGLWAFSLWFFVGIYAVINGLHSIGLGRGG